MENKKILIVEDQADLAGLLSLHFQDLGADTTCAADGHEGLRQACARQWDLILLDIQLPGPSGLEILRKVRQNENYVPILLLTSRSTELDRVLGLDIGADDYLTKPFSVMELIARVKAIFRRVDALNQTQPAPNGDILSFGELQIDEQSREAQLNGKILDLTAKEFNLLLHFCRKPGRVFQRSELLDSVWGYGHDGYEHTVNSHINRLRSKMEVDPKNPQYIVTVWGVGYKLDATNLH
ncbi:response regulator transcription factor [Pseudomaricurvus alkylphenolicus]|jgi:DNA-binding response OmpR family regulator|uniref:response regulator transcription factor n=1 Tax=Pseudomaricurvus alkylphenolicus TaxID=1306991 RepID=UPI00141E6DD4|nr:response regulator transcription factor [Pseudomaricurvus alkylphenolicus]NIB44513.1 response regulator transcription factor [Pseudomaricurvus alkylphenolicus]